MHSIFFPRKKTMKHLVDHEELFMCSGEMIKSSQVMSVVFFFFLINICFPLDGMCFELNPE